MSETSNIVAYWLLPGGDVMRELEPIVGELADRFDAPRFEPHVTVHAGPGGAEEARTLVGRLADRTRPVVLAAEEIRCSEEFTKTLFIQFAPSSPLDNLHRAIEAGCRHRSNYELNPHLSLLYADIDRGRLRNLAETIRVPFREIVFDALAAVSAPGRNTTRADVLSWRTIRKETLT